MERDSSIAARVFACLVVAAVLGAGTAGIAAASASAGSALSGPTTDSIDETTEPVENTTDTTTDTLENTTDNTTETVENTTDTTTGTLENESDETLDETTETIDDTTDTTTDTVDEAGETINDSTLENALEASVGTDGRNSSPDGSSTGDAAAENESADGGGGEGGGSDRSGAPGTTQTAADAVLVGLLGAITASGAAAGGAGASGATGVSTATAGWLHALRETGTIRRAGDLWKLLPVFRYSQYDDSDPLEHDRRRAVYEAIRDDPGAYLTQISNSTDIPLSTVRYHVRILEDEGLITATKLNGKRRYFRDADDAELQAALAEPAKRDVLEALADLGRAHNGRLADELERDPSTVSHHLASLEEDGLVVREKDGRSIVNELPPRVEAALGGDGAPPAESNAAPADD